jgi:hypothetical protein
MGQILCHSSVAAPDFHPRVIAKALLENLRQMTVSVDQAWHDDHLRAVDSLCDRQTARLNPPSHLSDGPLMNENLLPFENRLRGVQSDKGCVFQQDGHETLTSQA